MKARKNLDAVATRLAQLHDDLLTGGEADEVDAGAPINRGARDDDRVALAGRDVNARALANKIIAEPFNVDVGDDAAGAGAPELTPGLAIVPKKGHLVITDRYPGFCRHQLVELGYLKSAHGQEAESVAFNLQPRATGQLLVGSSREFVGMDASINRSLVRRMLGRAVEYVPALAGLLALRTWVGFRPATADNLPYVGPMPDVEGLWIAAGHEGLGITTALGTARLIADMVAGRPPEIDPAPYAPGRTMTGGGHG